MKHFLTPLKYLLIFLMIIIGGDVAPIGYILGIIFCVVGGVVVAQVHHTNDLLVGIILCIVGGIILFFRIRQDVIEIRNASSK